MKKSLLLISILFLTGHNYSQWVRVMNVAGNQKVKCYTSSGNYVFSGSNAGLYGSSNSGYNWYYVPISGAPMGTVWGACLFGNLLFASVENYGTFLSTDFGATWRTDTNGLGSSLAFSFASNRTNFYAGMYLGGIYMRPVLRNNWVQISNGLNGTTVGSILTYGNYLFAATDQLGIFRTSNNGTNWTDINYGIGGALGVYTIAMLENKIFVGTRTGIYYTTNNGDTWINDDIGVPPAQILKLTVSGNYILASGGVGVGVYLTTNEGNNWFSFYDGLPMIQNTYIYALGSNSIFFFIGPQFLTDGFGIWKRPLSDITAVNNTNTEIPERFSLFQNYPNPFNPSTKISYDLPSTVNVNLVVYDVLGREVKTLVNEKQNAGKHEIEFDASNYPSGVYYYKLSTDNFSQTKKMVLIK